MPTVENLDIKEFWPEDGPDTKEIEKYIKKYLKEKIVIKCGGRVLLDPDLFNNFINDLIILKKLGLKPIVVHGGGPRIKKRLDDLKIETKFIMGLRVTNEKVIKVVESVMTEFNKEIVEALEKKGCKAKSITPAENNVIYVEQKNIELGYVGKPTKVDDIRNGLVFAGVIVPADAVNVTFFRLVATVPPKSESPIASRICFVGCTSASAVYVKLP